MNQNHAELCPSPEWAAHLPGDVLPALCDGLELGPRMLGIGPATLLTRPQTVGSGAFTVSVDHGFTFRACTPDAQHDGVWERTS